MANMAACPPLDDKSKDFPLLPTQVMEPETLRPPSLLLNNANLLKSKFVIDGNNGSTHEVDLIPIKRPHFIYGIPRVRWTDEEVDRINIIEGLQYTIISKFSYGCPDLEGLKLQLP